MKKNLFVAMLLAFVTTCAFAAESGGYTTHGVGLTTVSDDKGNSGISGTGFSLGIAAGYNYNKYVGGEVGLHVLGIAGWNVTSVPVSAMLVGHLPVTEGISVVGKYGTAYNTLVYKGNSTLSGMTPVWGVGVEFAPQNGTTYRFGMDRFDMSVAPGTSVQGNHFNITAVERF